MVERKNKRRGEEIIIKTALEFKKGSVMWTYKMKAFITKETGWEKMATTT